MTRRLDDGQRRAAGGLKAALGLCALLLLLVAALLIRPQWALAFLPSGAGGIPAVAWLAANATPIVALAGAVVALLSLLALRRAGSGRPTPELPAPGEMTEMERLRRQIAPLATGDLAIRLPDEGGASGEVAGTLNLLVGAVSDLARVADEAAVQVLALVQDLRAGAGRLQAEGEQGGQLASDLAEHARQAVVSARALAERIKGAELSAGRASRRNQSEDSAVAGVQPSVAADVAAIVEVVADLAEHAHVLAVEVGIKEASGTGRGALQAIGDEVARLAERAAGALRRIEPLADAVCTAPGELPAGDRLRLSTRQAAGLTASAATLADQVAVLPEIAARLHDAAARVQRGSGDILAAVDAFAELARQLRRASGRFRVAS